MTTPTPWLSVVVIAHNMQREIPRTLLSLTPRYQIDVEASEYEVLVVDNGSTQPLDASTVSAFGPNFSYHYYETVSKSPVAAINDAVARSSGQYVMICIDGARILSPGIFDLTRKAVAMVKSPVVGTLSWHLGPAVQNKSVLDGYCQAVEDDLLNTVDWQGDGYRLFDIATIAGARKGWFLPYSESNCITISRQAFRALHGFEEGFQTVGGGLANLDFFKRAIESHGQQLVTLIGEGTFHQFHGGVATNVPHEKHPFATFAAEYEELRGSRYSQPKPSIRPLYIGHIGEAAARWMQASVERRQGQDTSW